MHIPVLQGLSHASTVDGFFNGILKFMCHFHRKKEKTRCQWYRGRRAFSQDRRLACKTVQVKQAGGCKMEYR